MIRLLKTALLLLMIIALPVQGFAATLKACGPGHHTAMPAVEAHHHDDAATQEHHGDAEHLGDATHGDDAPSHDKAKDASKSASCSACAACCVGAAAPPPACIQASAHHRLQRAVAASSAPLPSHLTAGLERPPKTLSA